VIERIAFIGTGLLGAPMVERLIAAGLGVRVWNRSPEKVAPLVAKGALAADAPRDAVADAQMTCLCLTDSAAIEELLFGPADLSAALAPGALLVDFSTVGPKATRALASRLQYVRPDIQWIDAPVSGGVRGAQTGELVVMCGGDSDAVALAQPVMAHLAKRICHLGPLGSGQAAKLCNQLIVSANIVAITEALLVARDQGLELSAIPEALAGGWADSLPLQIIGSRMAKGVVDPPIVSIGTYVKDLALVLDSAGPGYALAEKVSEMLVAAGADGHHATDVSALIDRIAASRA